MLDVPGHTAGHIAYFAQPVDADPLLFCGDTLFSAGCGRLFEGTPAQLHASLQALAALPPQTRVCCAHEYTLSNLRFAREVDPANPALAAYGAWCEAHHDADPWSQGGKTDLDDGVLYCTWHHHRAHDDRYDATRMPDGSVRFTRRT